MLSYTKDEIRELAGEKSYDRGIDYIEQVYDLMADEKSATATVHGTGQYEVRLDLAGGLDGECDCPWGREGNFCKHCVATALLLLYQAEHGIAVPEPAARPLDDYLASLDRDELVELLQEASDRDPSLRERLHLRAATAHAGHGDTERVRVIIDRLLTVDDFLGYREALDFASQVDDVTRRLTDLHEAGHGAAVVGLAQHALATLAQQYGYVDDSSGAVGGAAADLAALHARVCADVRPDPVTLATWILWFQTGDNAWQEISIVDYQEALGQAGLASYGERLAAQWRERPAGGHDHRRYRLHHLLQNWARACGDTDLLVTVLSDRDPYGVQYERIAEVLTEAGRHAEALEWAERGLADGRPHDSLVDFVASRYAEAGRTADVLTLRRDQFTRSRHLRAYQQLREAALATEPAGTGSWPELRTEVLRLLRPAGSPHRRQFPSDNVLIEVLLWEGVTDEAWAAAQQHGASSPQWLRLAQAQATTHPADAIGVYQRLVAEQVEQRQKHTYAHAADLLVRIRTLASGLGQEDEFAGYLAQLRRTHKPKRNFMAALDERGL